VRYDADADAGAGAEGAEVDDVEGWQDGEALTTGLGIGGSAVVLEHKSRILDIGYMMEVGRKRRIGRVLRWIEGLWQACREMTGIFCASRVRGLRLVLSASLQGGWHACSYWVMIGYGHGR